MLAENKNRNIYGIFKLLMLLLLKIAGVVVRKDGHLSNVAIAALPCLFSCLKEGEGKDATSVFAENITQKQTKEYTL